MIRRETDTGLIDRISNLPEVRPFICYHDGPLDWGSALERCIILSNGIDGIAAFEESGVAGAYQGHVFFARSCRGRRARDDARNMLSWLFGRTSAEVVYGVIPERNRAMRWLARQIGAEVVGRDTYENEGPVELVVIRRAA